MVLNGRWVQRLVDSRAKVVMGRLIIQEGREERNLDHDGREDLILGVFDPMQSPQSTSVVSRACMDGYSTNRTGQDIVDRSKAEGRDHSREDPSCSTPEPTQCAKSRRSIRSSVHKHQAEPR